MANLFQKLEIQAFRAGITPRTAESREWFRKKAQALRRINRETLMKDDALRLTKENLPGSMVMYFYDPKHKETLPYYDKFPLVFIVGSAKGGFHGLNLHYLPPILRAKLLGKLIDLKNNNAYNESTRLKLSYELISKSSQYKEFAPCFKHYLTAHVKSRFAMVPAAEWEIATFLPMAQWEKSSSNQVYKQSRKMI